MKTNQIYINLRKALHLVTVLCVLISTTNAAHALTSEQKAMIDSGVSYYNIEEQNTTGGGSCSLPGNNNEEKVWSYFVAKEGYSPEIAAGIIGNMTAESAVLPMRLQGKPTTEEYSSQTVESRTGIGWGLVQWTPPGKMITPSRNEGSTYEQINTVEHQVEFLWRQLEGTAPSSNEKPAGDDLKQQTTVAGAARSFMLKYERPAEENRTESKIQSRIQLAEDTFNRLSSLAGGSGGCASSGEWTWPMDPVGTVTSCFGPRQSPGGIGSSNHKGLDISAGGNGKILAAGAGTVSFARSTDQGGYGIHLIIDHGNGFKSLYGHASRLHKNQGDTVAANEHIADEGSTGTSTGAHLHFEIHENDSQINALDKVRLPDNIVNSANCTGGAN